MFYLPDCVLNTTSWPWLIAPHQFFQLLHYNELPQVVSHYNLTHSQLIELQIQFHPGILMIQRRWFTIVHFSKLRQNWFNIKIFVTKVTKISSKWKKEPAVKNITLLQSGAENQHREYHKPKLTLKLQENFG